MQVEADLTGSAEEGGEARVVSVQADATKPARGVTTAVSQASKFLIPQPTKRMSVAATVKKKSFNTPCNSSREKFIKLLFLCHYDLNSS